MHMTYTLTQFIKWKNIIKQISNLTTVHRRSISRAVGPSPANVFHPRQPLSLLSWWSGGGGGPGGPTLPVSPTSPGEHEKDEWIIFYSLHYIWIYVYRTSWKAPEYAIMFTPWAVILFGKSTLRHFSQANHGAYSNAYTAEGSEQEFRRWFTNGLNRQSLVSSVTQASEWSERVRFLMKKQKTMTTTTECF